MTTTVFPAGTPFTELTHEILLRELEKEIAESPNQCGDCDLCCSALEVTDTDINKPMHERCEHQAECGGCAIYDKRPKLCRSFYCTWMLSPILNFGLPDKLKPSECGFVLHWDPFRSPILMTLFIDKERPNAWVKHKASLFTIARRHNVAIAIGGGVEATHIITPRGHILAKADFPEYFNGLSVGLPSNEYLQGMG